MRQFVKVYNAKMKNIFVELVVSKNYMIRFNYGVLFARFIFLQIQNINK